MANKILVVDDEPDIVLSLEFLMKQAGFQVRTASDGEAALAAVAAEQPDLVLLSFTTGNDVRENYEPLKARLQAEGYVFRSATDTEVVAHLIADCLKSQAAGTRRDQKALIAAVQSALSEAQQEGGNRCLRAQARAPEEGRPQTAAG